MPKMKCDVFYGWTNDPLTDSNLAVRPLDTTAIQRALLNYAGNITLQPI